MKKLLSFVIALVLITNVLSAVIFAEEANETTAPETEQITVNELQNEAAPQTVTDPLYAYEPPLCIELEKKHYQSNELIALTVTLASAYEYTDHSYAATGFTVLNVLPSGNAAFEVTLQYDGTTPEPIFDFTVQTADSGSFTETVFCVNTDSGLFLSNYSIEAAVDNAGFYMYENGEISYEEYQALLNAYSSELETESTPQITAPALEQIGGGYDTQAVINTYYVQKTFTWEDDDGITHPLQYSKVEIYANNALLTTLYTSASGTISYSFTSTAIRVSVYAIVYAGGENSMVNKPDGTSYCDVLDAQLLSNMGTEYDVNVATFPQQGSYDMSETLGKAIQVSQAINVATQYVKAMNGSYLPYANVSFPSSNEEDNDHLCSYNATTQTINVPATQRDLDSYTAWDSIMAAYNYHIRACRGFDDNYLNIYTKFDSVLASSYFTDTDIKEYGINLAWTEAQAIVFAEMCQLYYASTLQNIYTVADSMHTSYYSSSASNLTLNFENCTAKNGGTLWTKGDACIASVASLLWDMFDSGTNESHDTMSMTHQAYWNMIKNSNADNLSEFVAYYEASNTKPNTFKLGSLLSYHKMAPSGVTMSSPLIPITVLWTDNVISSSYPTTSFEVLYYNENNVLILSQPVTTNSYTITNAQRNAIMNSFGDTFKVVIRSNQNSSPATSYISEAITVVKPINNQNGIVNINNFEDARYWENVIHLTPGSYYELDIMFSQAGYKVIQTFGEKDTVLELYSSAGTLLLDASDTDDEGYDVNAYLQYNFSANVHYKLRVRFFSTDQFGNIKIAVIPAKGCTAGSLTNITCLSDILTLSQCTTHTITPTVNYSNLIVFEPSTSGTYTFELSSYWDAYLYVIDMTSTDYLEEDVNYNDDYTAGTDSCVTIDLASGNSYLIVCTAYDITDDSEIASLTLTISQ